MSTQTQTAPAESQTGTEKRLAPRQIPTIVGIGASAGGLEALESFLRRIPPASGMAYVVLQHQDPDAGSILPELLQRATPLPVVLATNLMPVADDHIYVAPPDKDLSLLHGVLQLFDPVKQRGLRRPIDAFLSALAEDRQDKAIGVILSGMGSDGTVGLRAIKEKGGLTLVQSPASARFDGMPQSAINAGLADIVDAAGELPDKIFAWPLTKPAAGADKMAQQIALQKIAILLRERSANDFSLYKQNTVWRRIERRMGLHQIQSVDAYVRYLQENSQEVDLLFKELLIGVTRFFRDPDVWHYLKHEALPALFKATPDGKTLRAWVPACASGEEAYSLAMVFKEVQQNLDPHGLFSLQIFATDLDQDAINKARQGSYLSTISADVPAERLHRFFTQEENGWRIGKSIREMVIFAPQNLITDPPFTKLDILSCRNLLIYLTANLQSRLMQLFHYALNPEGLLLLGSAETVGTAHNLFAPLAGKHRLYRRKPGNLRSVQHVLPSKYFPMARPPMDDPKSANPATSLQSQAEKLLLQNFAPAAIVVTADGDIVYISGRTGKYLEPAAGKANWNIFAMAREGLRHELMIGIKQVMHQHDPVKLDGLRVIGNNANVQTVNVGIQLLDRASVHAPMLLIVFNEVAAPPAHKTSLMGTGPVETQLRDARDEIRIIREEMQNSQEELTSINEQLQSANEELQSTNEELTTSKEEMQSLNEELQTVNAELQAKVDDLSTINIDMKNLLDSIDITLVFLDGDLKVRRFTSQATKLFKLIPGDVGRHLSDIVHKLQYPEPGLIAAAEEALRSQVVNEQQIQDNDGHWFKVRIKPYRSVDNIEDGLVLTFVDISETKDREADLRLELEQQRKR